MSHTEAISNTFSIRAHRISSLSQTGTELKMSSMQNTFNETLTSTHLHCIKHSAPAVTRTYNTISKYTWDAICKYALLTQHLKENPNDCFKVLLNIFMMTHSFCFLATLGANRASKLYESFCPLESLRFLSSLFTLSLRVCTCVCVFVFLRCSSPHQSTLEQTSDSRSNKKTT